MSRIAIAAGLIVISAISLSGNIARLLAKFEDNAVQQETRVVETSVEPSQNVQPGSEMIRADARGHFLADFKINGRVVHGMIDTGATGVAINETTARRLGFARTDINYDHVSNTANGQVAYALVTLPVLQLGSIKVRDVHALVIKDRSLGDTMLVGMSFLKELRSFKVEDGKLYLKR